MKLVSDSKNLCNWAESLEHLIDDDRVFFTTALALAKAAGEIRLCAVYFSGPLTPSKIAAHEHLDLAWAALESISREDTHQWIFESVCEAKAYLRVTQRVWRSEGR